MSSPDDGNKPKTTITSSAEGKGARLSVKLSVNSRAATPALKQRYGVTKYELGVDYRIPETLTGMVPSKVDDYFDEGQAYVERVMRGMYYFKQVALVGPKGSGKTHAVTTVARLSGLPLWEVNCGLQTSARDLFGGYGGSQGEKWTEGTVLSWYRYGGILHLDEANLTRQDIAMKLNSALDTNGQIVLTEKDGEVVRRNPFAYAAVSMNPYSSGLLGNAPLEAMFRRRINVWIDFDYLSVGSRISPNEVKLIAERAKVPTDVAEKIIRTGAEIRRRYKSGDLPFGPSVSELVNWATFVADGVDPIVAADETIVSPASDDPEIQAIVRSIVALVFGAGDSKPVEKTEHP